MAESTPKDPRQTVDDEARALARGLARGARHAALAVLEPATGWPLASRVALATDFDGAPIILVSGLSAHTQALAAAPRCSLLAGEPGRGDPLAHPRITLSGRARRIDRASDEGRRVRRRYLARQPKASLYADFGDFAFWRIELDRGSLNGGFGKAWLLEREDLVDAVDLAEFEAAEPEVIAHMNGEHLQALRTCAARLVKDGQGEWMMSGFDRHGVDLVDGDRLLRLAFSRPLARVDGIRAALVELVRRPG